MNHLTRSCTLFPTPVDRGQAYLALVRELSATVAGWCVQKGIESALIGNGDVDSIAPKRDWPGIIEVFRDWASAHQLGPVIVCDHAPYILHLAAVDPLRAEFLELDVNRRKIFLGSTLFTPESVRPLVCTDQRGFRRLRPGAEAALKFVQNGTRRGGRPDFGGMRKKYIVELLNEDFEGLRQAAAIMFGPARHALIAGAEAVRRGGWDRAAMVKVETWCLLRSAIEPWNALARLRFRAARRQCPVLRLLLCGRRVPEDRERWLAEVARSHVMYRHSNALYTGARRDVS